MVHVKICGITSLADATVAVDAGADLIGFVFHPSSPRYIGPQQARDIADRLDRGRTKLVGVFVDEEFDRVQQIAAGVGLDLLQLHGDEPPIYLDGLGPSAYKALRPRSIQEGRALAEDYWNSARGHLPAFVVDAYNLGTYGGTGAHPDQTFAAEMARDFPILLAGGLNEGNVQDAITRVQPWGVDVSSGVEVAPGKKDHARVREFIRRAKELQV